MKRALLIISAGALLLLALYFWPSARGGPHSPSSTAASASPAPGPGRAPPAKSAPPEPRSDLADALNSPATDIRADLRLLSAILDTFRTNLPREGNPVGNNAEITAVLAGHNRLRLSLIPPNHPAIDRQRELCDRWGTPFFFHAQSATQMEIRSAGPDKKMWTEDDVVHSP